MAVGRISGEALGAGARPAVESLNDRCMSVVRRRDRGRNCDSKCDQNGDAIRVAVTSAVSNIST
jgi:hypothetical protein